MTNLVFVLPNYTQAQKRIYLPFFVILFPDCSMHSVCFFCFTEYAFIYIRSITLICSISHCMCKKCLRCKFTSQSSKYWCYSPDMASAILSFVLGPLFRILFIFKAEAPQVLFLADFVFVIPHSAQVQKCINLPFLAF